MSDPRSFRCPPAARWLGRILAASVLVSAMLLTARIHPGVEGSVWSDSRPLVVGFGFLFALAIVWTSRRLRAEYSCGPEGLRVSLGNHRRELPYEQIVDLTYEAPLVSRREWLPSLVLIDRFHERWRVTAFLEEGEAFVSELIRAAGRDDLESYASARQLRAKMARTRTRLMLGYGLALLVLAASLWFSMTGPV